MVHTLFVLSALQGGVVEVPFQKGENAIIIDAEVNGKKLSFMYDTGFSGSFVVDSSINLGKATGAMTLRDFVGEFQASTVKLNTIKLGAKTIEPEGKEAVMQPANYTFSYMTHCDGIMGLEVMRDQVFEINMQNNKLIFYPKTVDISQRKPDGKKTFLCKMLPKGMGSIELEVVASNGKKMHLALDTGNSFYATTHRDVLERIGLWEPGKNPKHVKQSFVASGAVDSWTKKMDNVNIFGVPVETSYWDIIDLPSSSAVDDGTVGFGFLKNFNITIDYARRRVWLENYTGSVTNDAIGTTGITAYFSPSRHAVTVARVSPDSPASGAGVKVGDQILTIDGKELVGAIGFAEVEALLEGKPGTKVVIGLSSGGNARRLELDRTILIND